MSQSHTQDFAYRRLGAAIIKRAIDDITYPSLIKPGAHMEEKQDDMIREAIQWFESKSEALGSYRWALSLTKVSPNSIRRYVEQIKQKRGYKNAV